MRATYQRSYSAYRTRTPVSKSSSRTTRGTLQQSTRRAASARQEPRHYRRPVRSRSIHTSPTLLSSDCFQYQEVNVTRRPKVLKVGRDGGRHASTAGRLSKPAHLLHNSTANSSLSGTTHNATYSHCSAKGGADYHSEQPLTVSELTNGASSLFSAESIQHITDQLTKANSNIAKLSQKLDKLAANGSLHSSAINNDTYKTPHGDKAPTNQMLQSQITDLARRFAKDLAEKKRTITAACSLSSALQNALHKNTIHSLELEAELEQKELQLRQLYRVNKNLELKLQMEPRDKTLRYTSVGSSHVTQQQASQRMRPSSAQGARRRPSSARQEHSPSYALKPASPDVILSQSLMESIGDHSYKDDRQLGDTSKLSSSKRAGSSELRHLVSITEALRAAQRDQSTPHRLSSPKTPQLQPNSQATHGSAQVSVARSTKNSLSRQVSRPSSARERRSPLCSKSQHKESAIESYTQAALSNEVSLWKDKCTEQNKTIESLTTEVVGLKKIVADRDAQLTLLQQQIMAIMAEKKLYADELSRLRADVHLGPSMVVQGSIANTMDSLGGSPAGGNGLTMQLEQKTLPSAFSNIANTNTTVNDGVSPPIRRSSARRSATRRECTGLMSELTKNNVSLSSLSSASILNSLDNKMAEESIADLDNHLYKASANALEASLILTTLMKSEQQQQQQQKPVDPKELKRLQKQERKQEKRQEKLIKRAVSNLSAAAGTTPLLSSRKSSRANSRANSRVDSCSKSAFSLCGSKRSRSRQLDRETEPEVEYIIDPAETVHVLQSVTNSAMSNSNYIAPKAAYAYEMVSILSEGRDTSVLQGDLNTNQQYAQQDRDVQNIL